MMSVERPGATARRADVLDRDRLAALVSEVSRRGDLATDRPAQRPAARPTSGQLSPLGRRCAEPPNTPAPLYGASDGAPANTRRGATIESRPVEFATSGLSNRLPGLRKPRLGLPLGLFGIAV